MTAWNSGLGLPWRTKSDGWLVRPLTGQLFSHESPSVTPKRFGVFLKCYLGYTQNPVQNQGFETGDTSGWYAFGAPTISMQTTQANPAVMAFAFLANKQTDPVRFYRLKLGS